MQLGKIHKNYRSGKPYRIVGAHPDKGTKGTYRGRVRQRIGDSWGPLRHVIETQLGEYIFVDDMRQLRKQDASS